MEPRCPTGLHPQPPHPPPLPLKRLLINHRDLPRGTKRLQTLLPARLRPNSTARTASGDWRQLLHRCSVKATEGSGLGSQSPLLPPCLQKRKLRSTRPRSQDCFLGKRLREPRWPAPQISVLLPPALPSLVLSHMESQLECQLFFYSQPWIPEKSSLQQTLTLHVTFRGPDSLPRQPLMS